MEFAYRYLYNGKAASHCRPTIDLNIYYDQKPYLAYAIEIKGCDWVFCQIDAHTGKLLYKENRVKSFDDGELPTIGTMSNTTTVDVHVFRYDDILYLARNFPDLSDGIGTTDFYDWFGEFEHYYTFTNFLTNKSISAWDAHNKNYGLK